MATTTFNKCADCHKTFRRPMDYNKHRKQHDKPFPCSLCDKMFGLKTDLNRHRLRHKASPFKYTCKVPGCNVAILRKDNLLRHLRDKHHFTQDSSSAESIRTYYDEAKCEEATYIGDEKDIQFLEVVAGGDEKLVSQLFIDEPDAWKQASVIRSALRVAAEKSHTHLLRRLLAIQTKPGSDMSEHLQWLYNEAASSDSDILLKSILDIGISPNTTFELHRYHRTTIPSSVSGSPQARRKEVNQVGTFLHAAAQKGCGKSIKLLLDNGADPELLTIPRDGKGEPFNALERAIFFKRIATAEVLVQYGVCTREKWARSNLPERARPWPLWAVKILIEQHGSLINATASSGRSLLQIMIKGGCQDEIVKFLVEKGVDVSMQGGYNKLSPLHVAVYNYSGESASTVELLINAHANLEARDINRRTPLHTAIGENKESNTKMLIDAHANLEARDNNERTPLHVAVRCYLPSQATVKMLIDAHANLEARDNDGKTPLHAAIECGWSNQANVKILIAAHADLEARDSEDRTPLRCLVLYSERWGWLDSHREVAKLLIDAGAQVDKSWKIWDEDVQRILGMDTM